jgi:hypothetical protein
VVRAGQRRSENKSGNPTQRLPTTSIAADRRFMPQREVAGAGRRQARSDTLPACRTRRPIMFAVE